MTYIAIPGQLRGGMTKRDIRGPNQQGSKTLLELIILWCTNVTSVVDCPPRVLPGGMERADTKLFFVLREPRLRLQDNISQIAGNGSQFTQYALLFWWAVTLPLFWEGREPGPGSWDGALFKKESADCRHHDRRLMRRVGCSNVQT